MPRQYGVRWRRLHGDISTLKNGLRDVVFLSVFSVLEIIEAAAAKTEIQIFLHFLAIASVPGMTFELYLQTSQLP